MDEDLGSINYKVLNGNTLLHNACGKNYPECIPPLLSKPGINVNAKNDFDCTPFYLTCVWGYEENARIMLNDPRVTINDIGSNGFTAVSMAAFYGHKSIIMEIIASGRDLCIGMGGNSDAVDKAKFTHQTDTLLLLERFQRDPASTRVEVRKELGLADSMAADLFMTITFLADEYLEIK